jgi:hypothetical protein
MPSINVHGIGLGFGAGRTSSKQQVGVLQHHQTNNMNGQTESRVFGAISLK